MTYEEFLRGASRFFVPDTTTRDAYRGGGLIGAAGSVADRTSQGVNRFLYGPQAAPRAQQPVAARPQGPTAQQFTEQNMGIGRVTPPEGYVNVGGEFMSPEKAAIANRPPVQGSTAAYGRMLDAAGRYREFGDPMAGGAVPVGTMVGQDGQLVSYDDWKARQAQPQAQGMHWNPTTRSYEPDRFPGQGMQQGMSMGAGYNIAAGRPEDNQARYAAALEGMRQQKEAGRRISQKERMETKRLETAERVAGAEQTSKAAVEQAKANARQQEQFQAHVFRLVEQANAGDVQQKVAASNMDAEFETKYYNPATEMIYAKYKTEMDALQKANPEFVYAASMSLQAALWDGKVAGKSPKEVADEWAEEWFGGGFFRKPKSAAFAK